MKNVKCPVCKRTDERIQLIYVPLGHGRYCKYLCCECMIVFPWGSNKFGDITEVEQIKKVGWVMNIVDSDENGENVIVPEKHPEFRKEK